MTAANVEFELNQEVVFAPYGDRLRAKVIEIHGPKSDDERIFYRLSLIKTGFKTLCTGKCIEGSKLFEGGKQ